MTDTDDMQTKIDELRIALSSCLRQMANPDPLHPAYKAAQEIGAKVYHSTGEVSR